MGACRGQCVLGFLSVSTGFSGSFPIPQVNTASILVAVATQAGSITTESTLTDCEFMYRILSSKRPPPIFVILWFACIYVIHTNVFDVSVHLHFLAHEYQVPIGAYSGKISYV